MSFNLLRLFDSKSKAKRLSIMEFLEKTPVEGLPLVSIILPAFNAENTIKNAIESVQAQTYEKWELLVIDDGSNDNTKYETECLSRDDSRIKLYKNINNQGVAYSRNVGLSFANGDFITFHDADDTSHVERLSSQLFELLLEKKIQLSICLYVRVNVDGGTLVMNGRKGRNFVSGMMFRKELMSSIGYFKPLNVSEDSEYHERVIAYFGKKSRKVINKILYFASFNTHSLLFSNAIVKVNGAKVDYKIKTENLSELEACRSIHRLIKSKKVTPYVEFTLDEKNTVQVIK